MVKCKQIIFAIRDERNFFTISVKILINFLFENFFIKYIPGNILTINPFINFSFFFAIDHLTTMGNNKWRNIPGNISVQLSPKKKEKITIFFQRSFTEQQQK